MRSVVVVSSEVEVTTWASRPSSCHPTPTARLVVAATTRADPVVARHLPRLRDYPVTPAPPLTMSSRLAVSTLSWSDGRREGLLGPHQGSPRFGRLPIPSW